MNKSETVVLKHLVTYKNNHGCHNYMQLIRAKIQSCYLPGTTPLVAMALIEIAVIMV